jgi:hypothetical protein
MIDRIAVVATCAIMIGACTGTAERVARGDRNIITTEQIEAVENTSAYNIVQRLRPHFLQPRGQTSISNPESVYPVVYVDDMMRGGVGELRQIPGSIVARIEYITPADATTRWGTGHPAGVIAVYTRRE